MTKAQIQQWLQYRVTIVDRCLNEKDVTTVLKVQYVCSKHEIKKGGKWSVNCTFGVNST